MFVVMIRSSNHGWLVGAPPVACFGPIKMVGNEAHHAILPNQLINLLQSVEFDPSATEFNRLASSTCTILSALQVLPNQRGMPVVPPI